MQILKTKSRISRRTSISSRVTSFFKPVSAETAKDININYYGKCLNTDRLDLILISKVRKLSKYPNDWCGNGSLKASIEAINNAEEFIRSLISIDKDIEPPYISLASDGEINFWWKLPKITLDLGLFGEGTYSYYAKLPDTELLKDDVPISEKLPDEILAALKK